MKLRTEKFYDYERIEKIRKESILLIKLKRTKQIEEAMDEQRKKKKKKNCLHSQAMVAK